MRSAYRRHGLVVGLALVAGVLSSVLRPAARPLTLPAISRVTAGTGWRVVSTYAPAWSPLLRQWLLRDAHGALALLYLSVARGVQMVRWSGELGYEGQGYVVLSRGRQTLPLREGTVAPVSVVVVQHLADRWLLAYAVVGPEGTAARATDHLLRTIWTLLMRGNEQPYYLVRVSVRHPLGDKAASAVATRLLAAVLAALRAAPASGA